jgi:ElaB/YqjD/DUF883 family membrane-anchored ribosome-binding protein
MASQTEAGETRQSKSTPSKSAITRSKTSRPRTRNATNGRPTRRAASSRNTGSGQAYIGELEQVIRNLEARVAQLTDSNGIRSTIGQASNQVGHAVSSASTQVGDMVADTLAEMAAKFRGSAQSVTSVARLGTGALQRIGDEVERRPFMTVAIALGLGFLAGMAGRSNAAGAAATRR